jgi:uncharacterized oligopeptide transporter (OPT) family protein
MTAIWGVIVAGSYAILQKYFMLLKMCLILLQGQVNKIFPSARIAGEITPEYMGVGYIIGPKIGGVLVAGGILSWFVFIPLLASLINPDLIAAQLAKLGYLADVTKPGGPGGWDPASHSFADWATAIYRAYVRQIGAGAVAAGGFITLIKTIPTIISSFKGSIGSLKGGKMASSDDVPRTERDLSIKIVGHRQSFTDIGDRFFASNFIPAVQLEANYYWDY